MGSADHWAVLAGLRFALALIVVNAHYGLALGNGAHSWSHSTGRSLGVLAAIVGFIMISGFSIAHSVENEPRGFFVRRIGRIAPLLWVVTVLNAAILYAYGPLSMQKGAYSFSGPELWQVATTALGLTAWTGGNFVGPCWSLSVEIAFYVAAPMLMLTRTLHVVLLIFISGLAYLTMPLIGGPLPNLKWGLAPLALFWAWGLGYLLWRERGAAPVVFALLLSGVGLLTCWNPEGGSYSSLTIIAVVAALAFGHQVKLTLKACRALNWLGDVSYPLFLLHWPLFIVLVGVFEAQSHFLFMISAFCTAVVGLYCIDRPGRRYICDIIASSRHATISAATKNE